MIANALNDKPLPVYGDGLNIRDWLYVEDHCSAIDLVLHKGINGEVYNIGGNNERTNIQIVQTILRELGKPESLIQYVKDRLGHDRRYGIDATKITNELGWEPKHNFDTGIHETIRWYLDNQDWWKRIQTGEYQQYFAQQYGERLGFSDEDLSVRANGQLGQDVVKILGTNHEVYGFGREQLDITNEHQCLEVLESLKPDVVIHSAAYTAVDLAETEEDKAYEINAFGTRNLAVAADKFGAKFCYISTDYVFDGTGTKPYREYDNTNPQSIYGKSKRAGNTSFKRLVSILL